MRVTGVTLPDRQRRAVATIAAAALFFGSTRASDGGFQGAVAKLSGASFAAGSAAGFGLAARLRAEVFKYENADRRR